MSRLQVNLLVNTFRPDAVNAARRMVAKLSDRGWEVGSDREAADTIGAKPVRPDQFSQSDLVITFGGDGTLIRAAHLCSKQGTPIVGIYYGRFGFVTQVDPEDADAAIDRYISGQSVIESRMMIRTDLMRAGQRIASLHSLNEAALQRAATTRMLTFEVVVDGHALAEYPADGVMVSTPTGSTAYNLSAGGPIIAPDLEAMVLTAIMPHNLSTRPLVLSPDSVLELAVDTRGDAVLSCDGQSRLHLLAGDRLRIQRSERVTRLVAFEEKDFLRKLAHRLKWSQGVVHDNGPASEEPPLENPVAGP